MFQMRPNELAAKAQLARMVLTGGRGPLWWDVTACFCKLMIGEDAMAPAERRLFQDIGRRLYGTEPDEWRGDVMEARAKAMSQRELTEIKRMLRELIKGLMAKKKPGR